MGGPRFDLFSLLVEAARAGLGVALVPRFLALGELESGQLLIPFDIPLRSEMGYHLVHPDPPGTNPALQRFTDWLLAQAAAYRSSPAAGAAAVPQT